MRGHKMHPVLSTWLNIIENMSNNNTYKLAWGRAIVELVSDMDVDVREEFIDITYKLLKYIQFPS
jgi:hypothetical protein